MKRTVAVLAAVASAYAGFAAFDSTAWFAKREMMRREAERLCDAYRKCAASSLDAADGVVVPLETHPDGSVKLSVSAGRARFFIREGLVWAEDVVIRKIDDTGAETVRIEAGRCVIDRTTRGGWADGPMRMTLGKTVFSGENVFFAPSEGYVMASTNSAVVSADLKFGGLL